MQSLPLYTSCLFSMLLNDGIVEFEKPDGIFLLYGIYTLLWDSSLFFYSKGMKADQAIKITIIFGCNSSK